AGPRLSRPAPHRHGRARRLCLGRPALFQPVGDCARHHRHCLERPALLRRELCRHARARRCPAPISVICKGEQVSPPSSSTRARCSRSPVIRSTTMSPRPYWKGYLKLSLVSCPIAVHAACSSSERISFRQINRTTGNRLRQQLIDEETREVVEADEHIIDIDSFV